MPASNGAISRAESAGHEPPRERGPAWERWLAIVLRSVHLTAVVALGGLLVGVPGPYGTHAAAVVLLSGGVLMAMDLRSSRLDLRELAGAFVALKMAMVAWIAWVPAYAPVLFWILVLGSALVSHAPKSTRHFRWWGAIPGRREKQG